MARRRAQDYDEKRGAILQRAAELFAEKGFTGASIMMIADACGVSKALLYHYYADKESVLFDVIRSHLQDLVDLVEAAAAGEHTGRSRLDAMVLALLEGYRDADAQHQVQIASLKLLPVTKQAELKALERRLVDIFSETLAAAIPELQRDPILLKPLTMSLFGMLNWHYLWFREGRGLSRAAYARMVSEIIVSGGQSVVRMHAVETT